MSDDYGYINARIRAMKSFLLKEDDYLAALRQKTQDEFIYFLSSLPVYSQDSRKASVEQPPDARCDEVLKSNLCRIFRKIINFCEGEPKRLIIILLTPWDIYNLNTIIRAILNHKAKDDVIRALIPAGRWEPDFLDRLAYATDLKGLAGALSD